MLAEAGYAGKPFKVLDHQGQIVDEGTVSADGSLPRLTSDEQQQLTLVLGSQQSQLTALPVTSPPTATNAADADQEFSDEDMQALMSSPYYATPGAESHSDADFLGGEMIHGLFS